MKKLPFLLVLFLFTAMQAVVAQDYYVLQVKGKIKIKESGKEVVPGDMLKATDELIFTTRESSAVVISKADGRMVLNGKKVEKSDEGEFLTLLKNALLPMKQNMQMSTRGSENDKIMNFKDYFGTESFAIIGDELRLRVDQDTYPVSNERIFVFRYEYNGKPINKVIQFEDDFMLVKKSVLFTVNSTEVTPEEYTKADIWYFNRSTDEKEKVVSFKPIFVSEEQLTREIELLKNFLEMNGTTKKGEIKREVLAFVNDVYGTTDADIFSEWLEDKKLL